MAEAAPRRSPGNGTRARAAMYRLLAEPFRFPVATRSESFASGEWASSLATASSELDYGLDLPQGLRLEVDPHTYEVEFIALHEVGLGGAPCPLHSGHHSRDRMRSMEEVVRFYRFFGFRAQQSPDCYPDHLTFELEFMSHLADRQSASEHNGGDVGSPVRAQRDFLKRHLLPWVPLLVDLIDSRSKLDFCRQTARFSHDFLARDCAFLDQRVRQSDCQNPGGQPHD